MPPSNDAAAAPPARWAAWLHALWGVRARLAWQNAGEVPPPQQRASLTGGGGEAPTLHLPQGLRERTALAAAAHAAAHWRFGGAPQRRAGLKPVQQALFETLEDARVEWLALRELPGLRALWLPLHAGAEPPTGSGFEALLARLACELLAPAPADPHPWIARVRAAFFEADGRTLALDTPAAVRAAASRLGNDIGQMRLPFAPRDWRPQAPYRDDGGWLWEPEPAAPQARDAAAAPPVPAPPLDAAEASAAAATVPVPYPEWDARIGRYRRDWCQVHVLEAPPAAVVPPDPAEAALRRTLQRTLRQGRGSVPRYDGRSASGEIFHPMALLDARLQRLAGDTPDPRVYRRLAWPAQPMAVQLLLDASASSGDRTASGRTVLDELLALGLACAGALEAAGHRSALWSFCSRTRERVELRPLKHWDEPADAAPVRARCAGQRSGGSTRTGAAVRHAAAGAAGFAARAGLRPLVLVLTDGNVHDVDVPDPAYLLADLRRAVHEAQGRGTGVACLQWGGGARGEAAVAQRPAGHAGGGGGGAVAPAGRLTRGSSYNGAMPSPAYTRAQSLPALLEQRIVILDGAMGTMIQRFRLTEADYRGERFRDHPKDVKNNGDLLVLTRPDVVRDIHEGYLAAGADIIETNTFGANRLAQDDYALGHLAREMNVAAAKLAREAADKFSTPERPRLVAGALGPTPRTASISPDVNDPGARNVDFEQLRAAYHEQVEGLIEGGVDLLLVETVFDTLNAKAALFAIDEVFEETGERLPVIISGTVTDASGRILSGQTVAAFWYSVRHAQPIAVGLNCALGAALMRPYIQELARVAPDTYISCYPNAGLPNPMSDTGFDEKPEDTSRLLREFAAEGLVNIVGGCCGTTPEHIAAIRQEVEPLAARSVQKQFFYKDAA